MSLINVPLMGSQGDLRRQLRSSSRLGTGLRGGDRDGASHVSSRPSEAGSIRTNLAGVPTYRQRRQSEQRRHRESSQSPSRPPHWGDSVHTNDRVVPSPPSLVSSIRQRPISSDAASVSIRTLRRATHRVGQVPNIHVVPPSTTGPARLRDRSHSRGSTRGPVIKHADEDTRGIRTPSPSELLPVAGARRRRSSSKASSMMERPESRQSSRATSSSSSRRQSRPQPSIRRVPSHRSASRHSRTPTVPFDVIPAPSPAPARPISPVRIPSRAGSVRSHHSVKRDIPPPRPIPFPVLPLSRSPSRTRPSIPVQAQARRRLPTLPNWRVMETGRAGWARLRRSGGQRVSKANANISSNDALLLPIQNRPRRHSEETHRSGSRGGVGSMKSIASQRSRSLPRIPTQALEAEARRSLSHSGPRAPSPVVVMGNVASQPSRGRTGSFGVWRRLGSMRVPSNVQRVDWERWRKRGGGTLWGRGRTREVGGAGVGRLQGDDGRKSRSRSTTRRISTPSSAQSHQRFLTTQRSRSLPRIPHSPRRRRHDSLPSTRSSRPSPRHRTVSLNIFTPFKKIGRVHVDYRRKFRRGREVDTGRGREVAMGKIEREKDVVSGTKSRRGRSAFRPMRFWGALARSLSRPPSLHPLLAPPTIFRPLRFTWDIRFPALPRKYVKDMYIRRSLEEPATNPPSPAFRLLIPIRLRNLTTPRQSSYWSTLIHPTGPTPITPLHILKSLAVTLRKPATPSEIAGIPRSRKEEVERAYTKRVRAGEGMGQGTEERERRVGVRRLDLLGRTVMWGGMKWVGGVEMLEEGERGGGWVVQLGETWI